MDNLFGLEIIHIYYKLDYFMYEDCPTDRRAGLRFNLAIQARISCGILVLPAYQLGVRCRILEHFARLVQLVSTSPNYAVNEPELSVPGLKATVKKMYSLNSAVVKARVALGNARITRNETLYSTDEAIYMVGRSARKYVRAIFGPNSEEFRQVRRFVFTKPRAR